MSSELEALVGHLFIVGGRALSTASPGATAVPAPRKAARGREGDTLFALLSLSESDRQPATFYETLTSNMAEAYFKVPGSVTSALRDSITTLNAALVDINKEREASITVGVACAVLRDSEVYIAVAGIARCFMIQNDTVSRLPSDDDLEEGLLALGSYSDADVRFFRHDIEPDDFLILADASLNRLTDTTFRHAVGSGDIDTILNNLGSVAGPFASANVIKFVEPLQDKGIETEVTEAERQPFFSFGKSKADTPADASPPVEEKPEEDAPSTPAKIGGTVLKSVAKATERVQKVTEQLSSEEETDNPLDTRLNLSPVAQVGVAVAVAIIVALLTTLVYRLRGESSQYEQLIQQAQTEVEAAREAGDDQAAARPRWENAVYLLEEAADLRAASPDLLELRNEAITVLDNYDSVTRVDPVLLRTYPEGTRLIGPVIQGLDVYLIDETSDILYREKLNESGTQLTTREPEIITRQGDLIDEDQVVSGLIDLVWMEEGGVPRPNVLGVLSRNGLLITYSPSFATDAVVLPGFEAWQEPRAIAVFDSDLYILDAGASEIWRYEASGDVYASAPQRYFVDDSPDLSTALDLQIDVNGNLYILFADGSIRKFFLGREQTFSYTGLPQPVERANSIYIDLSLAERAFFVADVAGGRIYTITPTGAFLRNYRDSDNALFYLTTGIFTLERPPYVYITAGDTLHYFSRPQ